MRKRIITLLTAAIAVLLMTGCAKQEPKTMRLLHWNIQNGMWDGQNDNYNRFVDFVRTQDPDVCVWCEAQSIWKTDSDEAMPKEERYLVEHWGELAKRYGHEYWGIGGYRDSYPQVITSKYPINYVKKITGDEQDVIVAHGAGWATIEVEGKTVNIVTLHTWPTDMPTGPRTARLRRPNRGATDTVPVKCSTSANTPSAPWKTQKTSYG